MNSPNAKYIFLANDSRTDPSLHIHTSPAPPLIPFFPHLSGEMWVLLSPTPLSFRAPPVLPTLLPSSSHLAPLRFHWSISLHISNSHQKVNFEFRKWNRCEKVDHMRPQGFERLCRKVMFTRCIFCRSFSGNADPLRRCK